MKAVYSVAEVCAKTSIGKTKLYEFIHLRLLKARKMGGRTIVLKDDLDEFLKELPEVGSLTSSGS